MEIYEAESKGVRAFGYRSGRRFIVQKGSCAVSDRGVTRSLRERENRAKLRAHLIAEGTLALVGDHYEFLEDTKFNSPSEAASIIWGSNINGLKVFGIEEEGKVSVVPPSFKRYYEVDDPRAIEGHRKDAILAVAERDREIVKARKLMDDFTCQACKARIVVNGKHVIECHHTEPVALGERVTTILDLVSLCPTCHRIAHMREPPYSVAELAQFGPNKAIESDAKDATRLGAAHG